MNSSFLGKMKQLTVERVTYAKQQATVDRLPPSSHRPIDFVLALGKHPKPRIIAEIKRQSPTRGSIALDLDPVSVAKSYQRAGAAAISILTEPTHFGGRLEDLCAVRAALSDMPLLMKDFVVDSYQLLEAQAAGADAVLLMVSLLELGQLKDLFQEAVDRQLTPLVEVHNEEELRIASDLKARLIGVNNRNLNNLEVDLRTSYRLASYGLSSCMMIAESGIESGQQVRDLSTLGYQAFLVGTQFMKNKTPEIALRNLIVEAG